MFALISIFFFLICFTVIVIGAMLRIPYFVHQEMTKDQGDFRYISYGTFKDLYQQYDWMPSKRFKDSLFVGSGLETELHAELFKFDRQYYMFQNPISYYMAKFYIKRQIDAYWKTHNLSWEDWVHNNYFSTINGIIYNGGKRQ